MKPAHRFAVLAICLLAACTHSAETRIDPDALREKLAAGDRADADKARDAGRKPADVVAFLGFGPGDVVLDVIAAGGYYTDVLAAAVGPEGQVYAQNPRFVLEFRDGANDKALTARLAGNRLPNVQRLDREMTDLGLEPGSVAGAITALNFHDIYNGRGADVAEGFLAAIYEVLEPGGVLGIIDHYGAAGADNAKLHRMEKALAIEVISKSSFVLEAESDVLRNPDDDHTLSVFDPSIRGQTDRFVLLLRKPAVP